MSCRLSVWERPTISGQENIDDLIFMQTGAPPHFANSIRARLDTKFLGRWLGRRRPREWPARSPVLTPCDFFLWGWAKDEVYRSKTSHTGRIESTDSTRYHQCPTQRPPEGSRFHRRSFEEIGGRHRCLHWILRYASVFLFNNVHIKLISINLYSKYRIYNPFSVPSYFLPTL
jgi:hypothetical protein